MEVERGWRDMKQIIDLRPVSHRLEGRIRAHIVLCWLALLLIRIIETTVGTTWQTARRELDRLHCGTFTGPDRPVPAGHHPHHASDRPARQARHPHPKQVLDLRPAPR